MRSIVNLSLPSQTAIEMKKRAKTRGFLSTSHYVRFLLELDENLISPDELLQMSKRADKEYASGKMKNYKSLSELL